MDLGDVADVANAGAAYLSLAVACTALWHTLRQAAREQRQQELDRLTLTREWLETDEALLLKITYEAEALHTKYAARIRVLKPATGRLSRPTMVPFAVMQGVAPYQIRSSGQRMGLDTDAVGARTLEAELHYTTAGDLTARVMLKSVPPMRTAVVQVRIFDLANGRTLATQVFPIQA